MGLWTGGVLGEGAFMLVLLEHKTFKTFMQYMYVCISTYLKCCI